MSIEIALPILTSSGSSSGSEGNEKPIDYVLIAAASHSQNYRASKEFRPNMIKPKGDKEERFNGCLADVEYGHFLPAK